MHTPGPWKIEPHDDCDKRYFVGPVMIDNDDVDQEEAEANGRLVSASPDLLAALQNMLETFGHMPDKKGKQGFGGTAVLIARKAVAKAMGDK